MPTTYTEELETLVAQAKAAERTAEIVHAFMAKGGEHRMSIVIDHPDPEIRTELEALASGLPMDVISRSLVKAVDRTAVKARDAVRVHVTTFNDLDIAEAGQ